MNNEIDIIRKEFILIWEGQLYLVETLYSAAYLQACRAEGSNKRDVLCSPRNYLGNN